MEAKSLKRKVVRLMAITGLLLSGGAISGLSGSSQTAQAATQTTIKLHKIETNDETTINNTGNEISDLTEYDPGKYGKVAFTLYHADKWFEDDEDLKDFNTKVQQHVAAMQSDQNDAETNLKQQNDYIESQGLNKIKTITSDEVGSEKTFNFNDVTNSGYYLLVESDAETGNVTKIATPMIFRLPIAGQADAETIHLYAKNQILSADPEVIKKGQDPKEPGGEAISLADVTFQLLGDDGNQIGKDIKTNQDGKIEIASLKPGNTYTLKEIANPDGYKLGEEVQIQFKVNKTGEVTILKDDQGIATVSGSTIQIMNHLQLGGQQFIKVKEGEEKTKLQGAEFLVKKAENSNDYAVLTSEGKFVKWGSKDEANAHPLVSGDNGQFKVSGFPHLDAGTKYYLEETKAPDGYSKTKDKIEFTIDSDSDKDTQAINITNASYGLPITGGTGIWIFVIAGVVLIGGGSYYYYRLRKRQLD